MQLIPEGCNYPFIGAATILTRKRDYLQCFLISVFSLLGRADY